jgi:hypothetical protein
MWEFLDSLRESGFVSARAIALLHRVSTIDEAFKIVDQHSS